MRIKEINPGLDKQLFEIPMGDSKLETRVRNFLQSPTELIEKVKDWLLKNKAHAYRDPLAEGYRIIINDDNTNGTKVMFIPDEHIVNDPMDVVQKVTDLLQGSTFFQSWDDDDE